MARKPKTTTLFHDCGEYYDPRLLFEQFDRIAQEMSYSNYTARLLSISERVIRAYCKEHCIPIGPTQETRQRREKKRRDAAMSAAMQASESGDAEALLKHIQRMSQ